MTGQVKEDILSRIGELGVFVKEGCICFNPKLLRRQEFLDASKDFHFTNLKKNSSVIKLEKDSLCFTYCQIPVIYKIANKNGVEVVFDKESNLEFKSLNLDAQTSKKVFERTGEISQIIVSLKI
jgi:hypothetical protein